MRLKILLVLVLVLVLENLKGWSKLKNYRLHLQQRYVKMLFDIMPSTRTTTRTITNKDNLSQFIRSKKSHGLLRRKTLDY